MPYRVALITPRSMLLNFPYGTSSSTNTGLEASEVWSSMEQICMLQIGLGCTHSIVVSGLVISDPACNVLRCDIDDKSRHLRTGYIDMIRVARENYSRTNLNQHKIFADQRHFIGL